MAFDEGLAERVREILAGDTGIEEKRMFGGLAFLANGNMVCGILDTELMARVGPRNYEAALGDRHVREMDFTGRPMRGFVMVASDAIEEDDTLGSWVRACLSFVLELPPK